MLRIFAPEGRASAEDAKKLSLRVRTVKKWTQGQLAKHLGVSRKTVESIEQDRYRTVADSVFAKLTELAK